MDDNNAQNAQNSPITCANGCGFYGNPINNNMCSKCFKELNQKNNASQAAATANVTTSGFTGKLAQPSQAPAPSVPSTPPTSSSSDASTPVQAPVPTVASNSANAVASPIIPVSSTPTPSSGSGVSTPTSIASDALEGLAPGERPPQVNKGRCYMCRAKIPLAKQTINKCRCEFVFCDSHKDTSKHDCDFDFAKMGKEMLTKNNPKLNDKPRGGRSFTRIQE
ncbi:zinc finger domain-containing protein [Mortierella hygrophila]|uniref:Zinc finger domain-containing protein n=1 Tax=Mortierella hygrophila TaxID=979708 RepID=A0A9P6F7P1_9FUNG|nr:zinc finger domain-containing protein [Mortierella hygrophila]